MRAMLCSPLARTDGTCGPGANRGRQVMSALHGWPVAKPRGSPYRGGVHDAHEREEDDGQQSGDGQRQGLCAPEERHQDDGVATLRFLQGRGRRNEKGHFA